MNYYEKLVARIGQSMQRNPKAAMVMDMSNFRIIAKARTMASLGKKLRGLPGESTVVFQKRSQKAAWIL